MKRVFLFITIVTFLVSCSSSIKIGEEKIVKRSGGDHDWTLKRSFEKKGDIYFVGEMTGVKNRSFGLDQAQANGMRQVINTLQNKATQVSGQALQGINIEEGDIGGYSKFAVSWIAENITLAGITTPQVYWEKVKKITENGVTYSYNCYALLKVSKKNYDKMIASAFEAARKKAQEDNNKKAEQFLNDVIKKLEQTP